MLVPATDVTPSDAAFVELCGNRWVLTEFERITDAPPYTCISYSWGTGRAENMFDAGQLMSDRTIPAMEATIKASQAPEHWGWALMRTPRDEQKEAEALAAALQASQAIWIDALCVPSRDPARAACLRSMGAIYSSAKQVFAVLPESCSNSLHKIHNRESMGLKELLALENDDWVTRAWTYQETANSKATYFIAQEDGNVLIDEHDFLNAILTDTTDYAASIKLEHTKLAAQFPRLDSLQEMVAENKLVEHTGRPVFQVMSTMHQRYAEREDDRIYAMIGVITDLQSDSVGNEDIHPAEYFMQVCERKNDFSFIYCTAPRNNIPGRRWRPVAGQISPVISGLLAYGRGQSGCMNATHIQLNNMCRIYPGTINSDARKTAGYFLQNQNAGMSSADFAAALLERLRRKGFSGCGDYLELENGYFFLQSTLQCSEEVFVAICQDVVWLNGGPGLLLQSNGTDINRFCDVGVFVGSYPKVSESINVS